MTWTGEPTFIRRSEARYDLHNNNHNEIEKYENWNETFLTFSCTTFKPSFELFSTLLLVRFTFMTVGFCYVCAHNSSISSATAAALLLSRHTANIVVGDLISSLGIPKLSDYYYRRNAWLISWLSGHIILMLERSKILLAWQKILKAGIAAAFQLTKATSKVLKTHLKTPFSDPLAFSRADKPSTRNARDL